MVRHVPCHTEQVTEARQAQCWALPRQARVSMRKPRAAHFPNRTADASVVRTNKVDTQFRFSKHCTQQVFSVKKHTSMRFVREFVLSLSYTCHTGLLLNQGTRGSGALHSFLVWTLVQEKWKLPTAWKCRKCTDKETKYLSFPPLHTHDSPHLSALSRQALLGQSAESNVSLEGGRGGAYLSL